MEDIEIFNNNIESYTQSIINTLSLDASIIESRINEELFNNYFSLYLKKYLNNKNEDEIIFNQIIIKLSKIENLYNRYAKDITNLSYDKYIKTIKNKLSNFNLIKNYMQYLDDIDCENEIESHIFNLYAKKILKNKLNNINDQKFFCKYLIVFILKNNEFKFPIKFIELPKIKKIKLIKKKSFSNYSINFNTNNCININLGMFNILKKESFSNALLYLINSLSFELQKQIQINKEYSLYYNEETYRFIKENIIHKEDINYFNENKMYFDKEITVNEEANKILTSLIDDPLFNDLGLEFSEDINENKKITKNYEKVDTYIDILLIKKPSIIKNNPILEMEYNIDGTRKNLKVLLKTKNDKINMYYNQINTFNELLENIDNQSQKNEIIIKKNEIENNLNGIIKCHNKMIYKALKIISISKLEEYLKNFSIDDINFIEEAIIQEKNDNIQKLEKNRKKIFKTSSFLANEKFLTDEYSTSARYESKINEIKLKRRV